MGRTVFLAFSLLATSVSAQVIETQVVNTPPVQTPQEIATQAALLAATIKTDIGDRVNTASAADLEGFIIFTVDQGTYSDEVVESALDILAKDATGNFAIAIENARIALRKKRKGTGAITNGGGGLGTGAATGGGDFPAPGVGSGGGETGYTA